MAEKREAFVIMRIDPHDASFKTAVIHGDAPVGFIENAMESLIEMYAIESPSLNRDRIPTKDEFNDLSRKILGPFLQAIQDLAEKVEVNNERI
jgi:hypothetical protein